MQDVTIMEKHSKPKCSCVTCEDNRKLTIMSLIALAQKYLRKPNSRLSLILTANYLLLLTLLCSVSVYKQVKNVF